MKRILVVEGDVSDFDRSFTVSKNLQEKLPTDLEMEEIPLQDLGDLA